MCEAVLGELRGRESRDFYRHVSQCRACRDEFREAQAALNLAAGYADAGLRPEVAERVLGPARAELAGIRARRRLRQVLMAAGAAAVLVTAVPLLPRDRTAVRPKAACTCWRFVEGDAGNSRWAQLETPCAPQQALWTQQVQGVPGAYKPLAWKDLVIIGSRLARRSYRGGGALEAFETGTGNRRWRREFRSGDFYKAKGFPDRCIQNGRLFVTDGASCLVLDAVSGRDLARLEPPDRSAGWAFLTASDSRLYGASRDGRTIFCVEPEIGRSVWSRSLDGAVFVPSLCGGRLYVHTDAGTLVALEAATGQERWRRERAGRPRRATVHARGQWVLVVSQTDDVSAFKAGSGDLVWRRRVPGAFLSGLALGDDAVYTVGGCAALALADGRMLWQPTGPISGMCSAPTVAGRQVLAPGGAPAGRLRLLKPSGELCARVDGVAEQACDGVIVAGGRIYLVGAGQLVAVPCRPTG